MEGCKIQPEDICYFWTYNKTEQSCKYSSILKVENSISGQEILTGSRICSGKCKSIYLKKSNRNFIMGLFLVFYPHCGEININYSGATLIELFNSTTITIEKCIQICGTMLECENWLMAFSEDFLTLYSCELRGAIPDGEASVPLKTNETTYIWGDKSCVKVESFANKKYFDFSVCIMFLHNA